MTGSEDAGVIIHLDAPGFQGVGEPQGALPAIRGHPQALLGNSWELLHGSLKQLPPSHRLLSGIPGPLRIRTGLGNLFISWSL